MNSRYLVAVLTLVSASSAFAEISQQEYAKCAVLKGDLERLACFDGLARSNDLDGRQVLPVKVEGTGSWDVTVDTNPIDDSKTVTLSLSASSGKSRWGKPIFLVLRCKSNSTDAYIGWNDYLGREANVLTRIGTAEATTSSWDLSTNSQATFHPKAISFIKGMLNAQKMIAQVTPYNENPVTAVFNTAGLNNAIVPLRETCGW